MIKIVQIQKLTIYYQCLCFQQYFKKKPIVISYQIQNSFFTIIFIIIQTTIKLFDTIGPPPHPKGATPEQTTPLKERKTPRVLYDNKVYIQNTKKNKNVKYTPSQTEL
eukprot:TRINITY_DN8261_c0_g2_i5.p6 TRINITY_DN8261_c0_g2~~TRINITY_DN8261_c0_g2_i5.p6  ORF type:complete len:108 (+),score=3.90 TRINITY_DN8261_c0_g2_i5:1169-1492(+)